MQLTNFLFLSEKHTYYLHYTYMRYHNYYNSVVIIKSLLNRNKSVDCKPGNVP